jgi:predicted XRE-type DNA-binding protein
MKKQTFSSVWDALEDTPEQAASLRARSALMRELERTISARNLKQAEAAEMFGVTQPRISDLMRGKIDLFSLDTLVDMAAKAELNPTIKVKSTKKTRHEHGSIHA